MKKTSKKLYVSLLACICAVVFFFSAPAAMAGDIDVPASAAIMVEQQSGRVLYEKSADERRPMASTTKIMTALIILEECDLDAVVEIDGRMSGIEGSSMYLEVGEKLTVSELLHGLLIRSGNDAAVALAIHARGSVENFVKRMNERAAEMGLKDTSFANPHGLHHAEHYTTARELAKIACAAMEHEVFREIIATERKVVSWDGHEWDRVLTNKNKILTLIEGGNGIKTGYTKAAGRCLVSAAVQDEMQLIAVTLNCGDDFAISAKLLQSGFDDYRMVTVAEKGTVLGKIKTDTGFANVVAQRDMAIPMKDGEQLLYEIEIPAAIHGSYQQGSVVGWLDIFDAGEDTGGEKGEKVAGFQLVLETGVDSDSFWGKIKMVVNNWS